MCQFPLSIVRIIISGNTPVVFYSSHALPNICWKFVALVSPLHSLPTGLHCEGIYRLSGVKSKVQQLRRQYNCGGPVRLTNQEPHVVASLLKQYLRSVNVGGSYTVFLLISNFYCIVEIHFVGTYFIPNFFTKYIHQRWPSLFWLCKRVIKILPIPRELPEPVLTSDMMPHFEDVAMIPNPGERAEAMRQLIDRLPTANRLLVQYMFKHMGHIIARVRVIVGRFFFSMLNCFTDMR